MRDHELTLSFPYATPGVATAVEQAIALDAGEIEGDRSEATVSQESDTVVVTVEADDPSALRAAKWTWCSLVRAAEETAVAAHGG